MKQVYNPGCALQMDRPEYVGKILAFLKQREGSGETAMHTICCQHDPQLAEGTQVINTCPGCDRRFGSLYQGVTTVSLWEILAQDDAFPFPDYGGISMSVHDACPVRENPKVHGAIRALLEKMHIRVQEAPQIRTKSVCCGDSMYPQLPIPEIEERMRRRAEAMPCQEVCVYCVSCIKSMHIGGKKPRYILDLLFGSPTSVGLYDTVQWHDRLQEFIDSH